MVPATRSMPTAPLSSGPASPSVRHSRSSTSTACRRRHTGARSRRLTPAIRAGKCSAIRAQFGNGFWARLAAEMRRTVTFAILNQSGASTLGGFRSPDIVGNLRVDQAWGSAQIMAAAHQCSSLYYSSVDTGHPDDKWGFAVGGVIKLNAPMIGQGDFFQAQVT